MKLLELLVQELPKRGGWPDGALYVCREIDGTPRIVGTGWHDNKSLSTFKVSGDKEMVDISQYEAALALAQQSVWSGEGLPPVGCECEARFIMGGEWLFFRCVAVDCEIAFGWSGKEPVTLNPSDYEFRPIRSEADKKRDEVIESLKYYVSATDASDLYDALVAGEVKGVKLDV